MVENSKWLIPTLSAAIAVAKLGTKMAGDPWYWKMIRTILDDFQQRAFQGISDREMSDSHRVTLYQHRRFCLFPGWRHWIWPWGHSNRGRWNGPWSGWLIPVARAGTEKNARTVFLARDGETGDFEGVAGATYFLQAPVARQTNLPDVHASCTADTLEEYARKTFVSVPWLQSRVSKGRTCSRCFLSCRLQVDGKRWGVLMIDTRLESLPAPQVTNHQFESTKAILEILLKRRGV